MDTKAIREKILSLAVRGQLVAQDPSEEPAHMLLERIREKKQRLIREKKIRAPKQESFIYRKADGSFYERTGKEEHCIDDELPFEIPDSWEWVRLGNLAIYKKGPFGSAITKSMFVPKSRETVKVYEQQNAIKKNALLGRYHISKEKYETLKQFTVYSKDIIVSCAGTIGETYVMPDDIELGIINQALMFIRLYDATLIDFYLMYFDAELKQSSRDAGKGTAISNIPALAILKEFLFPLPPLAEQKRIVSSIAEMTRHLDCITDNQQAIQRDLKAIREKSLNMAISGQLIPQDPTDEPAQKLLDRIHEEKQRLIKEKKIKAPKQESTIYRKADGSFYERIGKTETCIDDELPFTIPDSWEWVRLETICSYIQRGKSPKYSLIKKYPVVAQKCNQWSGFSMEKAQFIDPDTLAKYTEERILQDEDLLWNSTGLGTVGRMAIYKEQLNPYELAVADSHVTVIRLLKSFVNPSYVYSYIASPTVQLEIEGKASGSTKQKELNLLTVKNYLIPLPPMLEQEMIVEKLCLMRSYQ